MTPPRRPQPPLIDDGYLVEPEPVGPRIPEPGSARWVARQPGYLAPPRWPPFTLFAVTLGLGAAFALALNGNLVTALGGWLSLSLTFRLGQLVGRAE